MRYKPSSLLPIVVLVIVAGISWRLITQQHPAESAPTNDAARRSISTTTAFASSVGGSSTTGMAVSTTTRASLPAPPLNAAPPVIPEATEDEKAVLTKQVIAFEQAYYLLNAQDTPDTRRARIKPYATADFMAMVNMGIGTIPGKGLSNADRARVEQGFQVSATLEPADVSGEFLDATTAEITAIVTVTKTEGDKALPHIETHHTLWSKTPEGWRVAAQQPPGTD